MAAAFDPFSRPELINQTARYRHIARLSAVYEGKQYEGRANWWTGRHGGSGKEVPLLERKPCIVYRLPKASIQQVVRFLFGDERFPKISAESSDGSEDGYPELTEDDAGELSEWISALIEHANLQPSVRAFATKAVACKTAVVVLEADRGNYRVVLPEPQDCAAQFEDGDPTHPVTKLLWCYEFEKEVPDENGRPVCTRHIFRREWDATNVYVYPDTEKRHGEDVKWATPDVTPHGLSFCPVLWLRNDADCCGRSVDGASLIDGLEEEFEALDMALSRRHQGVIHLGTPQLVESAEELEQGPDTTGRPVSDVGAQYDHDHARTTSVGTVKGRARRQGPEYVWQYLGKQVDVKLLETSGKAFEVGTAHVNDIRSRILETMGVVLTSMADTISRVSTGAEMSARYLALAHAPLIALVQEYRHTWWAHGLAPLVSMLARMTVELEAAGQRIMIPGTQDALPILQRFQMEGQWVTPRLAPHWGKFFTLSSSELNESVGATVAARDGRLISEKTAVEFTASDFDIDSVETEIEEIEGDKIDAEAVESERRVAEMVALHGLASGENQTGNRSPGGAEPPDAAGGGSGSNAVAGPKAKRGRKRGRRGGRNRTPDRAQSDE